MVVVAKDFRSPDRDQSFLLPPDMRDWLAPDHLVWLVIRVIDKLDVSVFTRRAKLGGAGRAPTDPRMLVTLLVYAYANGERSSRQIERLCRTDVAFRVICGNEPPDHSVIARFRADHDEAFIVLFGQVLEVCAAAGLGRFATIAIDGTKIAANASMAATRGEDKIRGELAKILAEAAAVDAAEDELFGDARGDELPPELIDPTSREARLNEAIAQIEAEQAAEAADNAEQARVAHWDAKLVAAQARHDAALAAAREAWAKRSATNRRPVPPEEHSAVRREKRLLATTVARRDAALAKAQRAPQRKRSTHANTTDPQSRLIRTRTGAVQGYNTQLAVTDDQLIVAVTVTNDGVDVDQLIPMMDKVHDTVRRLRKVPGRHRTRIGTVLADGGYASEANLTAAGPPRLIPVKAAGSKPSPPGTATMRRRMQTPRANKRYRRRAAIVEPVNGHLKDRVGLRTFSRRGLNANNAEAHLSSLALNLLKLHRAAAA
jgi:transposase